MRIEKKDVYAKAIETYGAEAQTVMVFEEMAELQKELCKNLRGKDNTAAIAEEIADVQIVIEQMILLYDCQDKVDSIKTEKINRLWNRVNVEAIKEGRSYGG